MKKSLFSRYFILCASIILVSLTVFGFVFYAMSADYFRDEKMSALYRRAQQAQTLVAKDYFNNNGKYIDASALKANLEILSLATEADIILSDLDGNIIITTNHQVSVDINKKVPPDINTQAVNSKYSSVGKLGEIYDESCYIVGIPVKAGKTIIGAIYTSSSAKALSNLLEELIRMFIMGAVVILLISFVAIYFTTDALVNPLRAMLRATDSFAKGDFSVRVPIKGDDEVAQLAGAFNEMAMSLASQEAMSRSFVANVSHELRTPMTSIGGFIDGMLDGTIESENYGKYLRIVSDEVKRLSRMVISMLNISKIEAGEMKLNPSTIDVSEIMCRTVLGFEYIINEKNINIEGLDSEKNYALADADMVSQICYNLIENAVKFTQEKGLISVRYEHCGKMLKIAVRNSGDGIDKEEIPKLFDRFYKSDRSRSVNKKGVGLGLNIVKSLVNLHGGNITVKSVSGEYAEFEFTLPAAEVKSPPNIFRKVKKEL